MIVDNVDSETSLNGFLVLSVTQTKSKSSENNMSRRKNVVLHKYEKESLDSDYSVTNIDLFINGIRKLSGEHEHFLFLRDFSRTDKINHQLMFCVTPSFSVCFSLVRSKYIGG